MRELIFLLSLMLSAVSLLSQRMPDPGAESTLIALSEKYQSSASFEFAFDVTIEWPEEGNETWSGKYIQSGNEFILQVPQYDLYCDGQSTWTADKANQEILIQDFEPDQTGSDIFNPNSIFQLHNNEQLDYTSVFVGQKNGIVTQEIDFKPLDPNVPYSKLKLSIDKTNLEPLEAWMINKDGSRYMLSIQTITVHQDSQSIDFKVDQYPNYFVEDLRF